MNDRIPLFYEDGTLAGWLNKESFRVDLVDDTNNVKKDLPIEKKNGNVIHSDDRIIGYH